MMRQLTKYVGWTAGLLFAAFAILGAAHPQVPAPIVTVAPTCGPNGTIISVIGENFTGDGTVSANGIAVQEYGVGYAPTVLTSDGSFVVNNIRIRSAGLGPKTVGVTDSKGLYGSAIFTVTQPTIALSPLTATMGEPVTITGAGWLPWSSVEIALKSNSQAVFTFTAIAGPTGGIESMIDLPTMIGIGPKLVSFHAADTGGFGNAALAQELTVPAPIATLSATEVEVGTIVTMTGSGFIPYSAVTAFTIGGVGILEGASVTDSTGSLTIQFTVPGLIGSQLVAVSIGGTTISRALLVNNTPAVPSSTPEPSPGTPVTEVFADLIANGNNLVRIFRFDNQEKKWNFFDPRPEFAQANSLTTTKPGDIVWLNMASPQEFQDQTLTAGWNLVALT